MTWWLTKSPWNDERVARLKALWAQDVPATLIATTLGDGITRNAVLGKVFRLGLNKTVRRVPRLKKEAQRKGYDGALTRAIRKRRDKLPKLSRHRLPEEPVIAAPPLHIAFADLQPQHCHWPYGDGPFTFCGHPRLGERSYCAQHEAIAWRDKRGKSKRAAKRKGGFRLPDLRRRPSHKQKARKAA